MNGAQLRDFASDLTLSRKGRLRQSDLMRGPAWEGVPLILLQQN